MVEERDFFGDRKICQEGIGDWAIMSAFTLLFTKEFVDAIRHFLFRFCSRRLVALSRPLPFRSRVCGFRKIRSSTRQFFDQLDCQGYPGIQRLL